MFYPKSAIEKEKRAKKARTAASPFEAGVSR
jgi:hypothetical protein